MRALHVPEAGAEPRLGDLPIPTPGAGEVLIRVRAVGLNPVDNAVAAGMFAQMMPHEYPLVLGRDAAGVVEAVGDGVKDIAVGDEVLGHVPMVPPVRAGSLAEFAVFPTTAVVRKPAALSWAVAAGLPVAGAAAVAAIDAIAPNAGETVLVNGASGGVGAFAVQLLHRRGATIVATGRAEDADRLRRMGAATVIDFTAGPVGDQVRAAYPDGVEALINLVGHTNDDIPLAAVRKGGRVASTTMVPDDDALAKHGLTGRGVMATPIRDITGPLAEQAVNGSLEVPIDAVLPLERAHEGLVRLATGPVRGKIIVTVGDGTADQR